VVRADAAGRRRWLDAFFDAARLSVEIDGLWHMEAGAWWADMFRSNALIVGGASVLRYPSFVIRDEPVLVAAQVAGFLDRAA
jgi:very-short-patch-repair endonuclease